MGVADPGSPAARTTQALLWRSGAPAEEVASMATLVAVGYRAHTALRHAAGARLDAPRLFDKVLRQLRGPRHAAAVWGLGIAGGSE